MYSQDAPDPKAKSLFIDNTSSKGARTVTHRSAGTAGMRRV